MSIMCCVYAPEGIVLAADSRLTRTKVIKKPLEIANADGVIEKVIVPETTYTSSDNAQKVLFIRKASVGVSFCGNAIIDGATVADSIRKFEIERVSENDRTEEIARELASCYKGTGTHFFIGGYDDDVPFVFDVIDGVVKRSNIAETSSSGVQVAKDAADDESVDLPEVGVPENLRLTMEDNGGVIDESAPIVRYGAMWAGQMTAVTKIVNNEPILNADWNTMPLKDAIDFAEFLVDATIKYERFL